METLQKAPESLPYYVENDKTKPCKTLCDARCLAGTWQRMGVHRSLQIYQGDEVVDLKRF